MKNRILSGLLVVGALLFGAVAPAVAQTTTTSTTLSAAVQPNDRFVTLASTTNVSIGGLLYMDREAMGILSVNTTTGQTGVTRGFGGTSNGNFDAIVHPSGATVYVASPTTISNIFRDYNKVGGCTAVNETYLPQINILTGERQTCTNSVWTTPYIYNANLQLPTTAGGVPVLSDCGPTSGNANCANTNVNAGGKVFFGSATLSSNAAIITFPSAFTGTTTYECVANDITTRANVVQMVSTSSTTATITNTTGGSDVINWICAGR